MHRSSWVAENAWAECGPFLAVAAYILVGLVSFGWLWWWTHKGLDAKSLLEKAR